MKIATERIENNRPGNFYDRVYPINESLTKGKNKITVKFQAHSGSWAGGLFGLNILKAKPGAANKAEVPASEMETQIQRNVTFIVTSDAHYDAFENEDRNVRVRDTLRHMNTIDQIAWPDEFGGDTIQQPRGVLVLGDVIDDGNTKPTYESQGAEDFYGHSWGFGGVESDFYCAIVRYEPTPNGGSRVAMVRARDTDRITFRKSCKILYTYKHDLGPAYDHTTGKGKAPALGPFIDGASLDAPYRSCIYYYSND